MNLREAFTKKWYGIHYSHGMDWHWGIVHHPGGIFESTCITRNSRTGDILAQVWHGPFKVPIDVELPWTRAKCQVVCPICQTLSGLV